MKKSLGTLLTTVTCLTVFAFPASATIHSNVPQEVQKYAETDGLVAAKKTLMVDPSGFGFTNVQEVNDLTVGIGFQVYSIDPEKLQSAQSLRAIAKADQSWEFILSANGKVKSFLTIDKKDGKLELEGVGGKAEDFQAALNNFDAQMSQQGQSTEPILLKDMTVRYLIGNKDQHELVISDVPSTRAIASGSITNTKMLDSSEILNNLKSGQMESGKSTVQKYGGTTAATNLVDRPELESKSKFPVMSSLVLTAVLGILGTGFYRGRKKTN